MTIFKVAAWFSQGSYGIVKKMGYFKEWQRNSVFVGNPKQCFWIIFKVCIIVKRGGVFLEGGVL